MLAITSQPIDFLEVREDIRDVRCGGVVIFEGVVRSEDDGAHRVVALEYEAHVTMAIAEFERIAEDLRNAHPNVRLAMVHRTGRIAVGEAAVVVAVAAPHRDEAFVACRYAIDELKAHAPIWKREHFSDGSSHWRANDCTHDASV